MEIIPILIAGGVFLVILLAMYAVNRYSAALLKERSVVNRAMKWNTAGEAGYDDFFDESDDDREQDLPRKPRFGGNAELYTELPRHFQRAGFYSPRQIRFYESVRYVLLVAPLVVSLLYFFITHRVFTAQYALATLTATCICYFLPVFWLRIHSFYRKNKFERFFPDSIDLMVVCVESGMGLDSAIHRVAQEMAISCPELAQEFKILSLELKTGKSRSECLRNLAVRIDLLEVSNLVNLLIQAEKFGTGVAKALRVHSDEMRHRRYNRMEEKAAKLPTKLVLPLIIFIFPALFVVVMGPALIQVYRVFLQ